ncbi:MAG: type II secretion system F family protein [Candidatus Aenigmatarchaeota archaeon]
MGFFKISFKFFYPIADLLLPYFSELKSDLKKAGIKLSTHEFIAKGIFLNILIFVIGLPVLSVILAFFLKSFLFGFLSSITTCLFILSVFFIIYMNYPKLVMNQKAKRIDEKIFFATIHLSTITSSKIPLNKVFEIFSKFTGYGELTEEISKIDNDIRIFGLDVNTALERAVERSPSKKLKELLWGILSTSISGGDVEVYLKEKARNFMSEYRTKLKDFSHQLGIYLEIYITAVVLGAIFFLILTSIVSGITGVSQQLLSLQFFIIFIFLPLISGIFTYMIKTATPGGD